MKGKRYCCMRIIVYIINKLILVIPVTILCCVAYMYMDIATILNAPELEPFVKDNGLFIVVIFLYVLCIPLGIYGMITENGSKGIFVNLLVVVLVLIVYILVESIYTRLSNQCVRKSISKKEIINIDGGKATFLQILLRTSIKYLTISFMPYMFLYYFVSKEHIMFHDLVAKTKLGTVEG